MKTLIMFASAIALATPALAQTTGTVTATPPAGDTMATPSTSAEPAMTPAATAPTDPKMIISTEFPTYDKDGNGSLSRAEFDAWMIALKDKSGEAAMKPAEKTTWLAGAFSSADKDKSKSVTLAELTTYLTAAG